MCRIHYDRSSDKGLDQLPGLADCIRTFFPTVSILQDVDQGCCLLPVKEIDYADKIIVVVETGVHCAGLSSRSANTRALPTPTEEVHWSIPREQVAKEERIAEDDGLGKSFVEGLHCGVG